MTLSECTTDKPSLVLSVLLCVCERERERERYIDIISHGRKRIEDSFETSQAK